MEVVGSGNSSYGNLQFKLIRNGLTNVRIAVLENAPYVSDVAMPWEWLDGKRPKNNLCTSFIIGTRGIMHKMIYLVTKRIA